MKPLYTEAQQLVFRDRWKVLELLKIALEEDDTRSFDEVVATYSLLQKEKRDHK